MIQHAYLHIAIYSPQRFLHFAVGDKYFQFVTLPFGLSLLPEYSQRYMHPFLLPYELRAFKLQGIFKLLMKGSSSFQLSANVHGTIQTGQAFSLNNQHPNISSPTYPLPAVPGPHFRHRPSKSLQENKLVSCLGLRIKETSPCDSPLKIWPFLMASFKAVLFVQFHQGLSNKAFCWHGTNMLPLYLLMLLSCQVINSPAW